MGNSEHECAKKSTSKTPLWNTSRMQPLQNYDGACRICGLFVCLHQRRQR